MQVSFKPTVHLHRQRKDKKYSVIIRIGFKSKYASLETEYTVDKTDINKKGEIKNRNILDKCNILIAKYREITDNLPDLKSLSIQEIKQEIENYLPHKKSLYFVEFFSKFLIENKKSPSLAIYNATYNHLVKFSGVNIPVTSITPRFLSDFEKYLSEKMKSRGVNLYLSTIRKIYNLIMDEYEYKGYEFRYPFRKYKIPKVKYPKTISLTKEQLRAIINIELKGIVPNRARDLFVISLLTLGTNAKDLYLLDKISERIEYNRSKTKNKRDDDAFISIKVEPELKPYLEKYKGNKQALIFSEIHKNTSQLNSAIRSGLKKVVEKINEAHGDVLITHLEYYDARRSIASVMRNKLGISKDDVAMCLNHVDKDNRVTDVYIERDFSILDKCNRKFID